MSSFGNNLKKKKIHFSPEYLRCGDSRVGFLIDDVERDHRLPRDQDAVLIDKGCDIINDDFSAGDGL